MKYTKILAEESVKIHEQDDSLDKNVVNPGFDLSITLALFQVVNTIYS